MTVYVDDMYKYTVGRFGRMKMSHMIGDTEEELHAMAAKIGVKRKWYQGDHYDVSMGCRMLAINAGAVAITYKELATINFDRKRAIVAGKPVPLLADLLIVRRGNAELLRKVSNGQAESVLRD